MAATEPKREHTLLINIWLNATRRSSKSDDFDDPLVVPSPDPKSQLNGPCNQSENETSPKTEAKLALFTQIYTGGERPHER